MKSIKNIKKNKGYAILFTIVVVGIISMITMGLSNAAFKQMILSSVAKDSMTAFYEADLGSECALYADNSTFLDSHPAPSTGTTFLCAGRTLSYTATSITSIKTEYKLTPADESSTDKCFRVIITKAVVGDTITTNVQASGYNICDKSNSRTVERAIEINY